VVPAGQGKNLFKRAKEEYYRNVANPSSERSKSMKSIYLCLLAAAGVMSAGVAQAADEEALAKSKNCLSCHAVDKKVVGPSYKDVAKKYTAKDEAMLAEKVIKGGKGVWGPVPMPPNTTVKPDEATRLVKWILSMK
jgi:cytochrome c